MVAVEATGDRERAVKFIEDKKLTYYLLEAEDEKLLIKKQFDIITWKITLIYRKVLDISASL